MLQFWKIATDNFFKFKLNFYVRLRCNTSLFLLKVLTAFAWTCLAAAATSVTTLGDKLQFGQLFKVCGNNFAQIAHTLFVKVSKYFIFLVE